MEHKPVKDFYGRILGWLADEGNRVVAKTFAYVILGYYYKDRDVTTDFYGRIICHGDATMSLILNQPK